MKSSLRFFSSSKFCFLEEIYNLGVGIGLRIKLQIFWENLCGPKLDSPIFIICVFLSKIKLGLLLSKIKQTFIFDCHKMLFPLELLLLKKFS